MKVEFMFEHFVNIRHAGCVFHYESIAWIDSHMDNWRRIYLQPTQQSFIIGLPRIVLSGQEIGTFSIKLWFSF